MIYVLPLHAVCADGYSQYSSAAMKVWIVFDAVIFEC